MYENFSLSSSILSTFNVAATHSSFANNIGLPNYSAAVSDPSELQLIKFYTHLDSA